MDEQGFFFAEDREQAEQARKRDQLKRTFGTPEFAAEYKRHLGSVHWRDLRRAALRRAGNSCEKCGVSNAPMDVHHQHYDTFGHETLEDVRVLCSICHGDADHAREQEKEARFEEAGERAQLENARDTFYTKKYGEHWSHHVPDEPNGDPDEFERWLDRKRERDEW